MTVAILALWAPAPAAEANRSLWWLAPFAVALGFAWSSGIVLPVGLLWLAALMAVAWAFSRDTAPRGWKIAAGVALLILGAGLLTHRLPGFNNPRVLAGVLFTPDAIPYRLHLNLDKVAFGLVFIGWCHSRATRAVEWRTLLSRAAPVAGGLIATILVTSLAFGYVRFAPKFPVEAWLWLWANLFLTCLAEEAFFRGFVQGQLQRIWQRLPRGQWLALLTAAVLFGVAHVAGGPVYVALSALAGVGYGWAYLRTGGRVEASILTHFALNTVHFFAFTYPALRTAT
ncbi:MAG: CPBP family intramembrane metalloprotease [Opitutaceae bacterium]|nr:CPBP family intramembrane metalloprotease [Opitutaceae bacterium]